MPLDKAELVKALKEAFKAGVDTEGWTADDSAEALATAIDDYVRGAEVIDVAVDVSDFAANPIGQGVQSAPGKLG